MVGSRGRLEVAGYNPANSMPKLQATRAVSAIWLALWLIAVVVAVVSVGALVKHHHIRTAPASLVLSTSQSSISADGLASLELLVHASDDRALDASLLQLQASQVRRPMEISWEQKQGRLLRATLRAGILPGMITISARGPGMKVAKIALAANPDFADSFHNGTPDFLRLTDADDRESFRRWFAALAERESLVPAEELPKEIVDCAALLRFCYREALKAHDASWLSAMNWQGLPVIPAVRKYQVPFTPMGAAIFRIKSGSFAADDLHNASFAEFADAKTIQRLNTYFVSRDTAALRPGDLLIFRQFDGRSPYHSMVFVGPSQLGNLDTAESVKSDWLVYHTGPTAGGAGEMRRTTLKALLQHPDARWRPIGSNPNFLGIYRWNILREDR